MPQIQTEVLVIGGGATGTGIIRDLAMRGFKAVLVEKGDLTHGTTGRYHGLLHSGGRYVVKDPQAAKECIQENRILRNIMPQCIEDTSGFFVVTPWDAVDYAPRFVEGCHNADIPVEEISIDEMLRAEPLLNPRISRCFRVPDASADSFLAADLNVASAREHAAKILTYHKVLKLLLTADIQNSAEIGESTAFPPENRVVGALCYDRVKDEEVIIYADMVINASGAWAGVIAESAGLNLPIIGGKGTMLAMNHRIVNTVINRCKMPSDGDILVPAHTVSVIGTTDVKITDPDHYAIEPWEVRLCIEEGDKLVPGFKDMRVLRAWAGVRPLYQETQTSDTRDITRAYILLDHEPRDGIAGLITITSGKWTTYRKMAEAAVDLVCEKLHTRRDCRTHLELLPQSQEQSGYHYLGARLDQIEKNFSYGDLVCECELATRDDVEKAITEGQAKTIDDIRREVRLGMGPCQGGYCTYRVAGILHDLAITRQDTPYPQNHVEETNVAIRDFLQERWKGLLPILWGQQLQQERLDELIYLSLLNADHAPGPKSSRLSPVNYLLPKNETNHPASEFTQKTLDTHRTVSQKHETNLDCLIIGGGLSGLFAAWHLSSQGKRVRVITKGWGTTHWGSGCIDVLGYFPLDMETPVDSPKESIERLIHNESQHPYAMVGINKLEEALSSLKQLCKDSGYPLAGSLDRNFMLPTALGTIRPTCLAPQSMINGDLRSKDPICIVGFKHFPDFYPNLIADNLSAIAIPTSSVVLDLDSLEKQQFMNGQSLATMFDTPEFRLILCQALKPRIKDVSRLGFPAVLGLMKSPKVVEDLELQLGLPVFEIPTLPPSIPGMRLHKILVAAIENNGGRVYTGMEAIHAESDDRRVIVVWTKAAAREKAHKAKATILATGGILGGGIKTTYDGYAHETVFNLPISAPHNRSAWFSPNFLTPGGHPIFRSGIVVDNKFRPYNENGQVEFENLYIAGSLINNCEPIHERSLEGVAIGTGYAIGQQLS